MITRDVTQELLRSAAEYPVVTILGPRQSGKTTLARMTFPEMPYFSLEDPDVRMAAEADPPGLSHRWKEAASWTRCNGFWFCFPISKAWSTGPGSAGGSS